MTLPALTDDDLTRIKMAKQAANEKLKALRDKLRKQRRSHSRTERNNLENQLAALAAPTGKPVIVEVDGERIYLDYELLKKFTKSLDRQHFWYTLRIQGLDFDRKLVVTYQHGLIDNCRGTAELFELPPRQRDLLHGLPKVELAN